MIGACQQMEEVSEALVNVNHEAITRVLCSSATLLIFVDLWIFVAFNLRCWVVKSKFGFLDCCNINLILHKDVFEDKDLRGKGF